MSVTVRSLGSGSSGNALVVETSRATVLVDCGLSVATMNRGLRPAGRSVDSIGVVLISHEHVDHVRGLQKVLKNGATMIATPGTHRALDAGRIGFRPIQAGDALEIADDVVARALAVSHDAEEPCGYCIDVAGARVTIVTDLGRTDDLLAEWIGTSDLIVLEANHDETMLRRGPYPAHLKRRVLSPHGHLSNDDCGRLLLQSLAASGQSRSIWLAHLSAVNNRPDLAVATVERALANAAARHDIRALPRTGTPIIWRSDDPLGSSTDARQLALF